MLWDYVMYILYVMLQMDFFGFVYFERGYEYLCF